MTELPQSSDDTAPVSDVASPHTRMPAEEGVWVFIIGDMIVFALFFQTFLYYGRLEPELFQAGQASLNPGLGLLNTFILLTSSWLVVLGVRAARAGIPARARQMFYGALALGGAFVVTKIFEYGDKISHDITPATDIFYMLYYVFTGIHLLHVFMGIAVLSLMIRASKKVANDATVRGLEGGGVFWHMVDLLWIILFPLIYLVQP